MMKKMTLLDTPLLSSSLSFFSRISLIAFLLFALNACKSIQYATPIDFPENTLEKNIQIISQDPIFQANTEKIPENWWLLFNDSQLDTFIQESLAKNPTLQIAKMKIMRAHFTADTVKAALFPYIYLGADISRQKLSRTGVIPFETGPKDSNTPVVSVPVRPGDERAVPEYFTLYETEINLRYSFDFWQKNRNAFKAALGIFQANIAEEAQAKLQLSITIAQVYYELQKNYKRLEIVEALVENRTQYFRLIEKRTQSNIDNALELQFADFTLSAARDNLLAIQNQIEINKYKLMAYLAGDFDEEICPTDISKQSLPKIPLPQDLPLSLISRRPDITAQLWLIESAGKQIEVAKAGFYPDFNIAAFFGFQTIHFAELFKWPSTFFNIDPAVTLPIFDGGRLLSNLRTSDINYALAILEYNQLILTAAREVLTSLSTVRNSFQRLEEIEKSSFYQSERFRLTKLRVKHHIDNDLKALISEEAMLVSQDQEVIAQERVIQAILELIKSLGGGYETRCE